MSKDFSKWHKTKSKINDLDSSQIYFKERDIWWCYFGANIGFEQDGKGAEFLRPVLLFKKFKRYTCWVIPLSLQIKYGDTYFLMLSESNRIRLASLSQMKLIDSKRLLKKVDSISAQEFIYIKEKVIALMP